MTGLNRTLIALAISTSLFTACNKDDAAKLPIKKSNIVSVAGDNNRFVSYSTIETPITVKALSELRASESIPAAAAIPEGVVSMMDVDGQGNAYAYWRAKNDTNYYLPQGEVCTEQLKLNGTINYYIDGELTLNLSGVSGDIYILPNGKLKIEGSSNINNVNIKCWGELDVDSNAVIFIGKGASFINYNSSEIKASKIQNQGEFEHYGDITLTSDIDCSGIGSSLTLHGSVTASFVKCHNSSVAQITGNVVTDTLVEVNNNASLKVGASLVVKNTEEGRIYATNNGAIDVADYIKCQTLELDSNGKVITHQETLVVCDNLIYRNNTAKIHNADMEGVYTVVVVKNLEEAWNSIDRLNGGGIDLHTDPEEYEHLDWTANVIFNGSTYIPEKGLRPEYGLRPVKPTPVYTLNHIGSIESVDKENISATSIDFVNNLAYFSWHKRGDEYDGYIDVTNTHNKSILSTLHSPTQDFNSINIVGNLICAAGADATGAIVSNINYSNSVVSAENLSVEGASANSILNVGANKWVTTNGGITILPENRFVPLKDAKYAVTSGDKVVVLAGVPAASLYVFEQNGELVKSFDCGTISVENGKNTIFADGNRIYVSLGVAGLRSYDLEGNLLNEFTEIKGGAVNGVSADENYIYIACGFSGLYILDKNNFSLIKSYTLNGASANFVKKASDGFIYLAYGLNGIHIFELQVQQ